MSTVLTSNNLATHKLNISSLFDDRVVTNARDDVRECLGIPERTLISVEHSELTYVLLYSCTLEYLCVEYLLSIFVL